MTSHRRCRGRGVVARSTVRDLGSSLCAAGPAILLSCGLLVSSGVGAQGPVPSGLDPDVTTIGSRLAVDPGEIVRPSVLTREQILARRPASLVEALQLLPGLHIDQAGGAGGAASLYVRGADPNYVLVYVDGVRVNDPTNDRGGGFDLATLDISDVERVELVRGPFSALYGGDALAGVLSIVTRRTVAAPGVTADLSGGSHDFHRATIKLRDRAGLWTHGVSFIERESAQAPGGGGARGHEVSAHASRHRSDTSVAFAARYASHRRRALPSDSGGTRYAVLRTLATGAPQDLSLGASLLRDLERGRAGLRVDYFEHEDRLSSPGVAPGIRDAFGIPASADRVSLQRWSGSLSAERALTSNVSGVLGGDLQREAGRDRGTLILGDSRIPTSFQLDRTVWAPYLELKLRAFGALGQIGLRRDCADGISAVDSPRLSVRWPIAADTLSFHAAWGKAFKLPSLYALGHPIIGNRTLRPERSEGVELGVELPLPGGAGDASVTLFRTDIDDGIDFEAGPPPQLVNRSRIRLEGAELVGNVSVASRLRLSSTLTWVRNEVDGVADRLRSRPKLRVAGAAVFTPNPRWSGSVTALRVSSVLDSSVPTGAVALPSYTRIDCALSWQASERLRIYAALDDATDRRAEAFVGFQPAGRTVRLGVEWHR